MAFNALVDEIRAGRRPVVNFLPGISEKDDEYAQPGMRARIIGAVPADEHEVVTLRLDFEEFAAHNAPFEDASYYDGQGIPRLTAREAGMYREQDDLYFDVPGGWSHLFEIADDAAVSLYSRFRAEGADCAYIVWLERQVLALQPAGQG